MPAVKYACVIKCQMFYMLYITYLYPTLNGCFANYTLGSESEYDLFLENLMAVSEVTGCEHLTYLSELANGRTKNRCYYALLKPRHNSSMVVDSFFSMILSYFCFLVAARSPCHGNDPRRKYMMTYAIDSTSSRRLCSENDLKNITLDINKTGAITLHKLSKCYEYWGCKHSKKLLK